MQQSTRNNIGQVPLVVGIIKSIINYSNHQSQAPPEMKKYIRESQDTKALIQEYVPFAYRSDQSKFQTLRKLNGYIPVRGDGNCFYTALAYQYFYYLIITNQEVYTSFKSKFTNQIIRCLSDLEINIKQEESREFMEQLFKEYDDIRCSNDKLRVFQNKFSDPQHILCALCVIFFRSVAFTCYKDNHEKIKDQIFYDLTLEIITWESMCDTNEIIISLLSQYLNLKFDIYYVDKQDCQLSSYEVEKPELTISMIFRPGHYSIAIVAIVEQPLKILRSSDKKEKELFLLFLKPFIDQQQSKLNGNDIIKKKLESWTSKSQLKPPLFQGIYTVRLDQQHIYTAIGYEWLKHKLYSSKLEFNKLKSMLYEMKIDLKTSVLEINNKDSLRFTSCLYEILNLFRQETLNKEKQFDDGFIQIWFNYNKGNIWIFIIILLRNLLYQGFLERQEEFQLHMNQEQIQNSILNWDQKLYDDTIIFSVLSKSLKLSIWIFQRDNAYNEPKRYDYGNAEHQIYLIQNRDRTYDIGIK